MFLRFFLRYDTEFALENWQDRTCQFSLAHVTCNHGVIVEDFRGISISPVISKILEHCILDRYKNFFISSDNQFGFKKEESLADAKVSARQQCVYEDPYIEEIYSKFAIDG